MQQICAFRDKFRQGGHKTVVELRQAMPPGAVIRRNSRYASFLEMDETHRYSSPLVMSGHLLQCSADGTTALRTWATSPALVAEAEFPQLLRMKLTRSATSLSFSRQAKAGIANC